MPVGVDFVGMADLQHARLIERFAHNLSYHPWHCIAEHRPLGNQNRARRRMYWELRRLRQTMNGTPHLEPTGAESFE